MTARTEPSFNLRGLPAPDLSGEITRRSGAAPDGAEPPPFPPSPHRFATAAVVVGALLVLALAGFLLVRSVGHGSSTASPPPPTTAPATACGDLIPGCTAERVPDLVLRGGETLGALGPVDGFDTGGIISSDEALRRDGKLEHYGEQAKQVRVVLGSADADSLRWGHGVRLFYAIEWNGVCGGPTSMTEGGAVPITPACNQGESTVLDATTGRFIVGGNEPGGFESPSVAPPGTSPSSAAGSPTPCEELVPGCAAERLNDLTILHGHLGALGSVVGISLRGIISFDDALRLGGPEAVGMHGKTVRVVLGSAGPGLKGDGTTLYYAIEWGDVCVTADGPAPLPGQTPPPLPCAARSWSTVIDAHTGDFVVEGTGPDPKSMPSDDAAPSAGPLESDTHDPQAVLVTLTAPLDLHEVGTGGLFLDPAEPGPGVVSAQEIVDAAWRQYGDLEPAAVRLTYGTVEGKPIWLITFEGTRCQFGPHPSQLPGTPQPEPSCITAWTDLVHGDTGKVIEDLGGSIPGW